MHLITYAATQKWDQGCPWHVSHRARIHLLDAKVDGFVDLLVTNNEDKTQLRRRPFRELHGKFLDAGVVGPPVQCSEEDGTCDKMVHVLHGFKERAGSSAADHYQYVLDIDVGATSQGCNRR